MQVQQIQEIQMREQLIQALIPRKAESLLLKEQQILQALQKNSFPIQMKQEPDGNGNWVDFDGNTYSFANDQDVYTEDGTSYYWHGEAADVYYMPVQ